MDRRRFISTVALAGIGMEALGNFPSPQDSQSPAIKIGIIGLDTSQVTMILSHINHIEGPGYDVVQPERDPLFADFKVTAAYPYGSQNIPSSMKQIPFYIEKMKENGIALVDSIPALLEKV